MKRFGIFVVFFCSLISTVFAEDGVMKTSPSGVAFGSQPDFRSLRLSPDGSKLVVIQYHPDGFDFVRTVDLKTMALKMVYSAGKDEIDIPWCHWATNIRVLCGIRWMTSMNGTYFPVTRLVGVDADGQNLTLLQPKQLKKEFSTNQDTVIDWEADNPGHVQVMVFKTFESAVADLDIYTARLSNTSRYQRNAYNWITDGHGNPRLRNYIDQSNHRWYVTDAKGWKWDVLHEVNAEDFSDTFTPYGFADNPDELLYFDDYNGRMALFTMDLAHGRKTRLVYANDHVDVQGLQTLGKYDRVVAATYIEDKQQQYFFDKDVKKIYELVTTAFHDKNINIVDEDWNRRYYLVFVNSDTDPGTYYRFDSKELKLDRIGAISSKLVKFSLAPMKSITYPAADKTPIPAFLTLPNRSKLTGLPAVILPHGGPSSRDVWGFDLLVQFLVANGYAVLQSNYRGSEGYGKNWLAEGAFHNWKTAISDVTAGAHYLIDQGIADPGRLCIVGWSYGGYAALMSAIENPALYRCIVSIAGVTDPRTLGYNELRFVGGRMAREFIGTDSEVVKEGSPLERANEIKIPVLLAQGEEDGNVPFKQGEMMYDALKEHNNSVEFIQYQHAAHDIKPERYRIDLFTRLEEFLKANTK